MRVSTVYSGRTRDERSENRWLVDKGIRITGAPVTLNYGCTSCDIVTHTPGRLQRGVRSIFAINGN